jgi:hypothetical protein
MVFFFLCHALVEHTVSISTDRLASKLDPHESRCLLTRSGTSNSSMGSGTSKQNAFGPAPAANRMACMCVPPRVKVVPTSVHAPPPPGSRHVRAWVHRRPRPRPEPSKPRRRLSGTRPCQVWTHPPGALALLSVPHLTWQDKLIA